MTCAVLITSLMAGFNIAIAQVPLHTFRYTEVVVVRRCSENSCSEKFLKINSKAPASFVTKVYFNTILLKETFAQVIFRDYFKIFQDSFFIKQL